MVQWRADPGTPPNIPELSTKELVDSGTDVVSRDRANPVGGDHAALVDDKGLRLDGRRFRIVGTGQDRAPDVGRCQWQIRRRCQGSWPTQAGSAFLRAASSGGLSA